MKIINFIFCAAILLLSATGCRQTSEDVPATVSVDTKVYAGFRLKSISINAVPSLATDTNPSSNADMYVTLAKSGAATPLLTSGVSNDIDALPFVYTLATPTELEQKTVYIVYVYDKDQPTATSDYSMGTVPFKLSDYNGKTSFQNSYNGTTITVQGEWY
jgi:hypothetical protein